MKSVDVTILMVSIKDYNNFGSKVVDAIYSKDTDKTFEVIVCHPEHIDDKRVVHITDNKKTGATSALNHCVRYSKGDVIFAINDDNDPTHDLFGAYDFLQSGIFSDKKFRVATFPGGNSPQISYNGPIASSSSCPGKEILDKLDCFVEVPRFPVMCYPIVDRETLVKHFDYCIFHPSLKYFGDIWLGGFLHLNGYEAHQYNGCFFRSIGGVDYGSSYCPIMKQNTKQFELEAFVNLYRLFKHYRPGKPYNYGLDLMLDHNFIVNKLGKN
jgi:glycosyltransferase involved in cell wall biosynthesis